MKKVLFIACSFPPLGGPGVQRSVKFVKYLRDYGYEPVVFTRECKNEKVLDYTLLRDIPEGVKIIRTKDYIYDDMNGILSVPGKIISRLLIPDYAGIWWKKVRHYAEEVVKKEKISLIYTTSAPCSDHLLGLYLKKKYPKLKWVTDFRDEWTKNPYLLEDKMYRLKISKERKMEDEVLDKADAVIANTPIMKKHFLEGKEFLEDKFYVIPNGYDTEDFSDVKVKLNKKSNKMVLTYTGALYGRRKPDTFFMALQQLICENKIEEEKIEIRLVGNYNVNRLNAQIKQYGLECIVKIVGLLPHDECIIEQLSSDVLVLIEGSGKGAEAFYTGKLFEYMNTNKPIVAILPENGVAADLVRESNIGLVASFDDVTEIKEMLLDYYKQWESGGINYSPNRNVIEKYDRRKLTEQLANIFTLLE